MNDDRPYLSDRPVTCIATGAGWQGVVTALEHLRTVVHALRRWPTPLAGEPIDSKLGLQLCTVTDELQSRVPKTRHRGWLLYDPSSPTPSSLPGCDTGLTAGWAPGASVWSSGLTSRANKRMLRSASSHGMPA